MVTTIQMSKRIDATLLKPKFTVKENNLDRKAFRYR